MGVEEQSDDKKRESELLLDAGERTLIKELDKEDNSKTDEIKPMVVLSLPATTMPAGSIRLFPSEAGSESKPAWMEELNRKNKEKREKAARDKENKKNNNFKEDNQEGKLEDEEIEDIPENKCCIII